MSNSSTRFVRYILFAVFGCAILYFITTSSLPTYTPPAGTSTPNNKPVGIGVEKPSISDSVASLLPPNPTPSEAANLKPPTTPNITPLTPSELSPPAPGERVNATFVTLARNTDLWEIARSIRQVEDRFNRNYNYDWVFLNDKPFDEEFKRVTTSLVSGKTHYGEIPKEHWSFPSWIDEKKAAAVREDMRQRKIIYGDSISYRHMCRFESGFFFRHELMMQFEYYWRVEPSVELFCDIHYDPFRFMVDNGKKYSFVLSLYEYVETIPTLWDSVKKFMKAHPEHIHPRNSMSFLSDDGGDTYNKCHFVRPSPTQVTAVLISPVVQFRNWLPLLPPLPRVHRLLLLP
jgi:alpha 1,2-mannosyltransferase